HSQQPTDFQLTEAAKSTYKPWDLTKSTPLIVSKLLDESQQKWDADDETGVHFAQTEIVNVEYHRDIAPILKRSCIACHSSKQDKEAGGRLDLDADDTLVDVDGEGKLPGTYVRLAADSKARFGYPSVNYKDWGYPQASRYVRMLQSRRSLLAWKVFGRRLDGF